MGQWAGIGLPLTPSSSLNQPSSPPSSAPRAEHQCAFSVRGPLKRPLLLVPTVTPVVFFAEWFSCQLGHFLQKIHISTAVCWRGLF